MTTIDLHTHSTASDGTDSPTALIRVAGAAGVDVVAITDHDTTRGWEEAATALRPGMTLVPGAEISCQFERTGQPPIAMHLLAYLFDAGNQPLAQRLDGLCLDRLERAERMVDLMADDGVPVSWVQIRDAAGGGTIGRPHLARALVAAGIVDSVDAAFAGPLSWRSPYYVPKGDIPVLEAISLVRAAGGVCVFAHPRRRGRQVDDAGIADLAAAGLHGIEVDHPDHDQQARLELAAMAADLGLVRTGSSDYHGTNKSTPIAACTTEPEEFLALVDAAGSAPITA
jgi:predicted metal-dependent phosphoesterase TrpH